MWYTRSFGNFRKQNENFGIFLKIWILFKKFGNFWTFWKLWKITSYNFQSRRQKIWRWEGYIDPSSVQFSNNLLIMKLWTPVGWVQFGAGGICHGGANCLQVGQDIGPWNLETLESEVCLNETFFSLVIVGLAVSIILFILSQVDNFNISTMYLQVHSLSDAAHVHGQRGSSVFPVLATQLLPHHPPYCWLWTPHPSGELSLIWLK